MEIFIIVLIVILVVIYVYQNTYFENFKNSEPIKIMVFTSHTCPHCVTYKKQTEHHIIEWAKKNNYLYENHDGSSDMANKHNVQYVPYCVIYKGSKHKPCIGNSITIDNIEKTINSM